MDGAHHAARRLVVPLFHHDLFLIPLVSQLMILFGVSGILYDILHFINESSNVDPLRLRKAPRISVVTAVVHIPPVVLPPVFP